MKKENIVKKNWEFQKIILLKKQLINKYLIIYYIKNKKFEIGISIPKKFANAVGRNYLKRQIKSILDKNININDVHYKIILIVRKDFIELPFAKKEEQVIKMFDKLNRIRNKE